jgi:hypothetical protein
MQLLPPLSRWLCIAAAILAPLPIAAEPLTGKVVSVTDGDTVRVLDAANVQHKVRLDGIDAPERGQPFGTVARDRLAATERDARVARSGLWADKAPVPPWEWARGKRHRGEAAAPTGVRGGVAGAVSQAPTPQGLRKPLRKNDIFFGAATVRRACSRCLLETNNVKH